jgi:hypothetical protein
MRVGFERRILTLWVIGTR